MTMTKNVLEHDLKCPVFDNQPIWRGWTNDIKNMMGNYLLLVSFFFMRREGFVSPASRMVAYTYWLTLRQSWRKVLRICMVCLSITEKWGCCLRCFDDSNVCSLSVANMSSAPALTAEYLIEIVVDDEKCRIKPVSSSALQANDLFQ